MAKKQGILPVANFSEDWFSNNVPIWEEVLKKFAHKPKLHFIEIGCFEGRATLWLLRNILTNHTSRISVIDTFEGSEEHDEMGVSTDELKLKFIQNLSEHLDRVDVYQGKSQDVLRDHWWRPNKYHMVYVDGSHKSSDVLTDAVLSFRILKPGGVMIFDDFRLKYSKDKMMNPGPGIRAFLVGFHGQYKVLHEGYQMIIQKNA